MCFQSWWNIMPTAMSSTKPRVTSHQVTRYRRSANRGMRDCRNT